MPSNHSEKYPSLQNHSVDEIYPWSVAVKESKERGLRCVPFHCLTGEFGPEFPVASGGFADAHGEAEAYCRQRLESEGVHGIHSIQAINAAAKLDALGGVTEPEPKPEIKNHTDNLTVERVIRARFAFTQRPNGDSLQELLDAIDALSASYGKFLLGMGLGRLIGHLSKNVPDRQARAQAFAEYDENKS